MEKIGAFKITKLIMSGFKSYSKRTEFCFGEQTIITGGNGRGKSSIADAISFVVTGLSFFGERKIDKLHSEDVPDIFVSMCFVDEQCTPHELVRTRKGNRMTISLDGLEVRQMDLNELFGERDVFLSIFNPLYFIEELGDDGKNLLQRYLPVIPPEEIIAHISNTVQQRLKEEYLVSPESRIKRLREEIRELEETSIYLQGQQDLAAAQREKNDTMLVALNERLEKLIIEKEQLEEKRFEDIDVNALQNELMELSTRYSELSGNALDVSMVTEFDESILKHTRLLGELRASVYEAKNTKEIAEVEECIKGLEEQYKRENGILKSIAHNGVCPTCRRAVKEADIPILKSVFQTTITDIVEKGKTQRARLEQLQKLEQDAEREFAKKKEAQIAQLETERKELADKRESDIAAANMAAEKAKVELERIRTRIQGITSDLEYGKLTTEEYERMKFYGNEVRNVQAELAAMQKACAVSAGNYAEKIAAVKEKIRENKEQVESLLMYVSKRAELTFKQLQMNRVAISLFDVMKSTGEIKDTFKFTYNGRRYDRLSLSEKIRAGMEASELIKKLTGRNYPVFVDNMESVDDLANVNPSGQVFISRCVRGAELAVKVLGPIAAEYKQAA